jgi:hypothetical protein
MTTSPNASIQTQFRTASSIKCPTLLADHVKAFSKEEFAMRPLGRVTRGVTASTLGTLVMDLLSYERHWRGGRESFLPPESPPRSAS